MFFLASGWIKVAATVACIAPILIAWIIILSLRKRRITQLPKLPFGDTIRPVVLPQTKVVDGNFFPMTCSPVGSGNGPDDCLAFVSAYRSELLDVVHEYGAVLLRGWGGGAEHFSEISTTLGLPVTDMACSAGPRFTVAPNVFTANEAPPSERIPFHHEMAQCDTPPAVVLFFCETAASIGGATPILQSHLAARFLRMHHPAVAARIERDGVRYVRVMPPVTDPSSALGKSWKHSLRVETAEAAEVALRALGSTWEWLPGGMLKTVTKVMPALLHEKRSGREVLFTAAESTFNAVEDETLDLMARAATNDSLSGKGTDTVEFGGLGEVDSVAHVSFRPTKSIIYGDGSPLDPATKAALHDTSQFMIKSQVAIPWQPGDVLLLDNSTVQHSREMFTPPRRILASLVGHLSKDGCLHEELIADTQLSHSQQLQGKHPLNKISPSSTMDVLPVGGL